MPLHMPDLETDRLIIRPFNNDDLDDIHRILDQELKEDFTRAQREAWLAWSSACPEQLANLYQFPLGDRAVLLKEGRKLIGTVGYTPSAMPFSLVPGLTQAPRGRASIEIGLYWAMSIHHQRQGYASEAGQALIDFAFDAHNLWRIVATTDRDNTSSQAVMRKLGMTLHENPEPQPAQFQVVGVREAP